MNEGEATKKGPELLPIPFFLRVGWWPSVGEHNFELFHDLLFWMSLRDGQFLDQQAARRVEHLALTERQLLVALEHQQITQDLSNLERRAGFDLFRVFAITPIPRLG